MESNERRWLFQWHESQKVIELWQRVWTAVPSVPHSVEDRWGATHTHHSCIWEARHTHCWESHAVHAEAAAVQCSVQEEQHHCVSASVCKCIPDSGWLAAKAFKWDVWTAKMVWLQPKNTLNHLDCCWLHSPYSNTPSSATTQQGSVLGWALFWSFLIEPDQYCHNWYYQPI